MNRKNFEHTGTLIISLLFTIMVILLTFTSCSTSKNLGFKSSVVSASTTKSPNKDSGTGSFDINVQINCRITLDNKIKGINPDIIKAARQAIFDYNCYNAKFSHYNGYTVNYDIYIFEVNEIDKNTWEVKFKMKPQNSGTYNKDGYSFATVEKQNSGSYKGYIVNSGGPNIRGDETY